MKEILHTYLKKSDTFVGVTLTLFFGMFTLFVFPVFVENYNLMITLQVFFFSIWIGTLFYRNQFLKKMKMNKKSNNCLKTLSDGGIILNID